MNAIEKIIKSNLCTGCGLCEGAKKNASVVMGLNQDGFSRPINLESLSRIDAEELAESCPGIQADYLMDIRKSAGDKGLCYDNMWGQYAEMFSGYSLDNDVRYLGSSGGVLTEISRYLLRKSLVDAVVMSTISKSDPLGVEVLLATTEREVVLAAGSKYCISPTLTIVDQIRKHAGTVAFVGKPCEVASLKLLAKKDSLIDSKVKYYFSFFCAGVPSRFATTALLKKMGVAHDSISDFWYRGRGWPGSTTATTFAKDTHEIPYSEAWGKVLSKDLQFRCKICADGVGELADVVVGDAWECDERGYPLFTEKPGESIVIARTSSGSELISLMHLDKAVNLSMLDPRSIDSMQPGQVRRRKALLARVLALKVFIRQTPKYPLSILFQYSKKVGVGGFLTGFFGMVRRLL